MELTEEQKVWIRTLGNPYATLNFVEEDEEISNEQEKQSE